VAAPLQEEQGVGDAGPDADALGRERLASPGEPVADPGVEGVEVEGDVVAGARVAHEIVEYWPRSTISTRLASSGSLARRSANFFFACSRLAGRNSVGQLPSCGW
jgi:hypothetical protein